MFLVLPPEAAVWAQAARLEQPPKEYDPITVFGLQSGPLALAQPAPFSVVSGIVDILGVLNEGTVEFDIQVGQGLRPDVWTLLAQRTVNGEINARTLWDTQGLSGVWAIQLQTVDETGVLRRTYSIVTIK